MGVHHTILVRAIPRATLEHIRRQGADDFGHPFRPQVAQSPGLPLRCCLRDAEAGERFALIAYRPAEVSGPYAEIGPVFVHAERCGGYATPDRYPEGFRARRQVLRAYDARGHQVDGAHRVVEGSGAEAAIAEALAVPGVTVLHSRNVLAGCYMFAVEGVAAVP